MILIILYRLAASSEGRLKNCAGPQKETLHAEEAVPTENGRNMLDVTVHNDLNFPTCTCFGLYYVRASTNRATFDQLLI